MGGDVSPPRGLGTPFRKNIEEGKTGLTEGQTEAPK